MFVLSPCHSELKWCVFNVTHLTNSGVAWQLIPRMVVHSVSVIFSKIRRSSWQQLRCDFRAFCLSHHSTCSANRCPCFAGSTYERLRDRPSTHMPDSSEALIWPSLHNIRSPYKRRDESSLNTDNKAVPRTKPTSGHYYFQPLHGRITTILTMDIRTFTILCLIICCCRG